MGTGMEIAGTGGQMISTGRVREFHGDDGWGVIDAEEVPGGCWVSFTVIAVDGYRKLTAGEHVRFAFETAAQDGYDFRVRAERRRPLPGIAAGQGPNVWLWRGRGSNQRMTTPTVLQTAPFGHSGNPPRPTAAGADGRIASRSRRSCRCSRAGARAKGGDGGRRVLVRRGEQGGPAGGRQRPQPGREGDLAALRLQGRRRLDRLERRDGRDAREQRGPGQGGARRVPDQVDQARRLAEGAGRWRPSAVGQGVPDRGRAQGGPVAGQREEDLQDHPRAGAQGRQ